MSAANAIHPKHLKNARALRRAKTLGSTGTPVPPPSEPPRGISSIPSITSIPTISGEYRRAAAGLPGSRHRSDSCHSIISPFNRTDSSRYQGARRGAAHSPPTPVPPLPMAYDRFGDPVQPPIVLAESQNSPTGEVLGGMRWNRSQRLQQSRPHQHGNVVLAATNEPGGLLRPDRRGQGSIPCFLIPASCSSFDRPAIDRIAVISASSDSIRMAAPGGLSIDHLRRPGLIPQDNQLRLNRLPINDERSAYHFDGTRTCVLTTQLFGAGLDSDEPVSDEKKEFLSLSTQPARLNSKETAWFVGFAEKEIPVLVAAGLLRPLGRPPRNGAITSRPRVLST